MNSKKQSPTVSSRQAAIQLLSRRDHGVNELYKKLAIKGYRQAEIEAAIDFCLQHHYLDDLRYAKSQVRQHVFKGNGERRIRQELAQKAIESPVIETALIEESQDWFELAKRAAQKKFKGYKANNSKEYAKQVRFLQYRGYSFDQIEYALNINDEDGTCTRIY